MSKLSICESIFKKHHGSSDGTSNISNKIAHYDTMTNLKLKI